jgi:hypothetical protein
VSEKRRRPADVAALEVDLQRAELGDRVRLRLRLEGVAGDLAAEAAAELEHDRAVDERALVEAGDAPVAAVDGLARVDAVGCARHRTYLLCPGLGRFQPRRGRFLAEPRSYAAHESLSTEAALT